MPADGTQTYQISAGPPVEHEIVIKKSRFLCYLCRITSEEESRACIAEIRGQHPHARHYCVAFRYIDAESGDIIRERSSDDGEPAGTAGRPMLGALQGAGLVNVCAVVVRYFGGIKLGAGGLVRAYSDAVSSAIIAASTTQRLTTPQTYHLWSVSVPVQDSGWWESELRAHQDVVDVRYCETPTGEPSPQWTVILCATCDEKSQQALGDHVQALSQGRYSPQPAGTLCREKPVVLPPSP